MGGSKKSAAPVTEKTPVITENNDGVPDDQDPRGIPVRDRAAPSTKSLLAPGEEKQKQGMLY